MTTARQTQTDQIGNHNQAIFVIGVSGTGKSTIAKALSDAIDGNFLDADDFHSADNVASMASGVPLTDDMRAGWLQDVCDATLAQNTNTTVACSALKKIYRDAIRARVANCRFVFLDVNTQVLAQRIASRTAHYMPVGLLASQLQTLQLPAPDETDIVTIDGTLPIKAIIQKAIVWHQLRV
ncbi:gluconokinase [Maritalea sp.]|jgi:gluconokinase|uniref:gluconokinase n=1 Tax=Maritalea sp. TaxID=2003361 RepID=UPI0039E21736